MDGFRQGRDDGTRLTSKIGLLHQGCSILADQQVAAKVLFISCLPSGGCPGYRSPDLIKLFFFQSSLAGICLTKEKHLNYRIATLGVKQWGEKSDERGQ